MSVVVTGCAGFIGSAVCAGLIEKGETVIGIDDMNDAYDPRLKEERLAHLLGSKNISFYKAGITRKQELLAVLEKAHEEGRVRAIINLAARAGVRQSVENPAIYFSTNVMGCLNLLEWAAAHGVDRFVQASSSSVYGALQERPFKEEAPTDRPLSPYAASKKASELLCHSFHHLYGIDTAVLRFFTVYGPAGRPDMSIFRFTRWIAEGEAVKVYGDGGQERDFTFIQDIADGVIKALGVKGFEVINLGSDRPVTLSEVIDILKGILDKDCHIKRMEASPLDVRATWADISRARKVLGWEPSTSIEEGLRQTVAWYLKNRDWASRLDLGDRSA